MSRIQDHEFDYLLVMFSAYSFTVDGLIYDIDIAPHQPYGAGQIPLPPESRGSAARASRAFPRRCVGGRQFLIPT